MLGYDYLYYDDEDCEFDDEYQECESCHTPLKIGEIDICDTCSHVLDEYEEELEMDMDYESSWYQDDDPTFYFDDDQYF